MTQSELSEAMKRAEGADRDARNAITNDEHMFAVALNAHMAGMLLSGRSLFTGSDVRQVTIMAHMLCTIPAPTGRNISTEVVGDAAVSTDPMIDKMHALVDSIPAEAQS